MSRSPLRARHTHLYPGARLRAEASLAEGETLVEFSDGVAAPAELTRSPGDWRLALAPHTTAKGASIPTKSWALAGPAGDPPELRVLRRLA